MNECVKVDAKQRRWNYRRLNALRLPGHQSGVRALDVSSDDSLIASASSAEVKVWNVDRGECVRTMSSGFGACCRLLFTWRLVVSWLCARGDAVIGRRMISQLVRRLFPQRSTRLAPPPASRALPAPWVDFICWSVRWPACRTLLSRSVREVPARKPACYPRHASRHCGPVRVGSGQPAALVRRARRRRVDDRPATGQTRVSE